MITTLGEFIGVFNERLEQMKRDPARSIPENARPMSEKFYDVLSTIDAEFAKDKGTDLDTSFDAQLERWTCMLGTLRPLEEDFDLKKSFEESQALTAGTGVKTAAFLAENPKIARGSKVVRGLTWTDELLASFAGGFTEEIDMSKSFDWNATGEHTLTADELSDLRKKYNMENLSRQDFYDLMADLSNLNAVSAEDVNEMFMKKMPPMTLSPSGQGYIFYPGGTEPEPGVPLFDEGKIFDALHAAFKAIEREKKFFLSDEFWKMNPDADKNAHSDYIDYLDFRANTMNKLYNLFSAIRE